MTQEDHGIVSNIQRYTIHDGPGIRTEIFFKGCNLHCPWCSNPETASPLPELGFYPAKCVGADKCGWCVQACPAGADTVLRFDSDNIVRPITTSRSCAECLRCAEACPGGGIKVWGKQYSVPELMKIIESDRSFYERSGGGVTLSGGEVLLQWRFAEKLLQACREARIGTCVESALHVPQAHLAAVLPLTDYLITDIKHMDPAVHKTLTGADNRQILQNIRHAAQSGARMVIRTPVVPGYNDSEENILETARFIRHELGSAVIQYQLLPYRKMGTEKLASLNLDYPMGDYQAPERTKWEKRLLHLAELAADCGVKAFAGSGHTWD